MSTISRIYREHRKVQNLLEQEQRQRFPDSKALSVLKKMKLMLKDKLNRTAKKSILT